MRYKKKNNLISLILSLCILLGAQPPFAAAEREDLTARGKQAWEMLTAVGVFSNDDGYISGRQISRHEFVRLLMKTGNYAPVQNPGNVFADVTDLSENAGYIDAAYNLGYIKGYADGNFYPDNTVTCTEAIRMISALLGYGMYAECSGGYSTGYIKTADRLKLLSGISVSPDERITWDAAMVMFENASRIDLLKEVSFGDAVKMESVPGETLLSENFSVYETDGVIEANEYTDLMAADSGLPEGCVLVNGTVYSAGSTLASDYLGMNVKIYYFDDDNAPAPEIKYIIPYKNKNAVTELSASDIADASVANGSISYTDANGKTKTVKLAKSVSLIRNGKMAELTKEKLMPEVGTVTLISNDGDSVYEVIKVMSYESYVVSGISASTGMVATKDGHKLMLDGEDDTYFTVIKRNGRKADFGEIKLNTVISYAESEAAGKKVKTAVLSDNAITGRVEKTDHDDKLIYIGGAEYRTIEKLAEILNVGREGTFYLDALDNIVYFDGELDIVYGYLNRIWTDNDEVFCRIFTENNRWVTLNLNKRVKVEGSRSLTPEEVFKKLGTSPEEYRQLVRYRVNIDGKIIVMETARVITMGTNEDKQAIRDDVFRLSSSGNTNYRNTTKAFNGIVGVAGNAKIFAVPAGTGISSNEDDFAIITQSDLQANEVYNYEAYDANEVRDSSVFVLNNYVRSINTSEAIAPMMVVQSIGQTLGFDDEVCPSITGYWGEEQKITLPVNLLSSSSVKDVTALSCGDIIQFTYNDKGEINNIEKKYGAGTKYSISPSAAYNAKSFVAGEVLAADAASGKMVVQYDSSGTSLQYAVGGAKIYIYNTEDKELYVGSTADLTEGDQIFTGARYFACREVFVIR